MARGFEFTANGKTLNTSTADLVQEVKDIGFPDLQETSIEIPGRDGIVDLSETLAGRQVFKNRKVHLEYFSDKKDSARDTLKSDFAYFHGATVSAKDLNDTKNGTSAIYTGKMTISFDEHGSYMRIVVDIDAQPFCYTKTTTYTRTLSTTAYTFKHTFTGKPGNCIYTCTGNIKAVHNGVTLNASGVTNMIDPRLNLSSSTDSISITGSGSLTIKVEEVWL